MNILYATQATGNGHLTRAIEIVPELKKYAQVDLMLSGYSADLKLPFKVDYKRRGISFYQNKTGGIDFLKSIRNTKARQIISDIKNFPINQYDILINDFEPISAWAARLKEVPSIGLSHQACFYSKIMPRPALKNSFQEKFIKYFAPIDDYIGFHFHEYDNRITTPIVKKSFRNIQPIDHNYILVYLPGYSSAFLKNYFSQFPDQTFKIYSREYNPHMDSKHIAFIPVGSSTWDKDFIHSKQVIMGAGFEGPSEALYLGKRLVAVPLKNQYEQLCNAAALEKLGVTVLPQLDHKSVPLLKNSFNSIPIKINYEDNLTRIVQIVLEKARLMTRMTNEKPNLPTNNLRNLVLKI